MENKYIGKTFVSNNYGEFVVIDYKSSSSVTVKFTSTGFVTNTTTYQICNGQVKDKLKPNVHGIGFLGEGPHKASEKNKDSLEYRRWHSMIQRCYDEKYLDKKPTYRGCTVCDEWHNFQNFAEWFKKNHPSDGKEYQVDKDIMFPGNRVYSPDTCMLVSLHENNSFAHAKMYKFISPAGEVVEIYNMKKFCLDNNLARSAMSLVSSGKAPHHKGWRVYGAD